ncbi:NAD(P)-dependent oxidoreductase [Actinomadura scrupuli]|uniref:NAD(P)-dependent oxidoreductase n=1 Tax=Actinomadura scrupuli TaxID=559629 RepID=UPI003D98AFB2
MIDGASPGDGGPPEAERARTVGWIGLGQMGAPMATHLTKGEYGLIVYDTRAEAVAPLVDLGAKSAAGPAEVARAAQLISVMVRDDDQVDEVAGELIPAARPGTVLAIHSTIRAETAIRLAARAQPYGVHVVDAPVSGSFVGATAGSLAVMVGGTVEAFERCREPFGAWAGLVLHVGPVGAGTHLKLARNLLQFAAFTAAAEAQRLAEAAGVSLRKLGRVVRHSDAITGGPGSIMLRSSTEPLDPQDPLYEIMRHVQALGEKDLTLALEMAEGLGVDTPFARMSLDLFATGLGLAPTPEPTPPP